MELELGLKITRTREDISSSVDFHFSKDPFGPLVLSQETDSRFIIIIHLKGFKKEGIEIDINKEGNRITVRGRKPVEEMVMIRWMAWMKEVEFRVFKKVFRIPDIVDLDKIKARFDDDDATLTITMPKRVKGVSGFKIEEEEEEERVEFGDVSEAGEVEEESIERAESDEHFETEIQREKESQVLEEEQKDEEETEVDNLEKILECKQEEEELADLDKENDESSLRKLPEIEGRDSHEQTRHEKQKLVVEQQSETKNDDFGSRVLEEIGDLEPDVLDRKSKIRAMEKEMADDDDDSYGLSTVQEIEESERRNEERKIREMVEQREEEETEDGNLDKIHQLDEQDNKILECIEKEEEEETTGLLELADSNKDSEDSSLRKLPDIEGRESHEQTRLEEQVNKMVEQQDSQAETNSSDFGSRAFEEDKEQEPDEQVDRIIESEATEKKTTDDDGDGLRKVQGIEEEAERQNEERKNQEMESKNRDAKEDVDGKMEEGSTPNNDRRQVVGEDDNEETETKAEEFESDEVDKIHELVEKKEEEVDNAKTRIKSEDKSLIKLQENEEQRSKGQKPHSKQENIKELFEEKTPEAETSIGNDIPKLIQETEIQEVDTLGTTCDEGKEGKKKNKIVKMEVKNGDGEEEVDAKMGEVFTPNIAETETKTESDQLKADEVDKIQKLVEKKDKDEENAKVGAQSEDIGEQKFQGQKRDDKQEKIKELVEEKTPETEANIGNDTPKLVQDRCEEIKKQPEEYKEKIMETGKKINDAAAARKVQEIIRKQELDEPSRCEKESKTRELVKCKTNDEEKKEKENAETETKEQESYRPKILREQEKTEELAEEKTKFSKNRKVKEEEEIAEKKTEFGDDYDDISRKVQDIEQRDSEAMKGQEEKDMIQELVLEEKLSDEGKGIIAEAETKAENDKSKKVQEIDEQQSHEEDTCGKQFQKLIGGEISGLGEVEDVEKEKKITEAEKIISDSPREAQEIGKIDSDVSEEYRGEKKDEADRPEKITGKIEQEFVKLSSQLEQDNIEDGEKTQELVEENIKDCEEEKDSEESKTKTDDDVVRKVQGIKEQELYEPTGEHVSKIKELVEEKTDDHEKEKENEISEWGIEAECGSLRKLDGSEEQKLHEPKIHKERDKTRITGAEEPSSQEKTAESMTVTENENSTNVQDFEEERPDKPESHEKRYQIQEVVEAGHNDRKIEQEEEKLTAKDELETEKESSKFFQKTEQQEYDELKRSMVDKMQETEETKKTRETEEKEIVERRTKTKDDSLKNIRDDEDLELSKPYKRQKEDKIQELVEMGTRDYSEKVKKQDEDDFLRSQEAGRPDLGEPSNIPQLVGEEQMENIAELRGGMEDDSSEKFHEFEEVKLNEDWTQEEREKREDLVKEEVPDPKDKHTVGEGHNDHKEKQQDEKVTAKAELKTVENSSKKVQDIEKQECDELKRSMVQDKKQETEEKGKTRTMDENEIVERREKTKDGNLRKVRGDEDQESSKPYKKPDLGEFERHGEQHNIPQLVGEEKAENNAEIGGEMEDDSSGKFHEFEEGKSYEDWTYEQREKRKDLIKEEATDLKDRHTGGKGHNDHKEEEQEENVIAKADFEKQELKSEEDISKKVREMEKEEYDGLKRSMVEDKMRETEETDKTRAMEEDEIVEGRKNTKDGSLGKFREGEYPELGRHKRHGEEDRVQELVEAEFSDHREKIKKKDEDDISRSQETGELDLGELERHCKQRKIHQSVEDEKGEGKVENIPQPGRKIKGYSSGKFHEFQKQKSYEDWRQEESKEMENLVKEEATDPKAKLTGGEGEHEEERYEKFAETKTKVEDKINKNAGENKQPESDKHEQYGKLDKLEEVVVREAANNCENEEKNLVDDFTTKIQETEKEESHELEMHAKLYVVPDFIEDETGDQEDKEADEAAAVVASNEIGSSRKVQTIEEESEKHKEQNKNPKTSDPEVKEDEERVAKKETEKLKAHVQELEGKTENSKDDNREYRRGEKGKQGKTVETIVRKIRKTKVKESNESENQEQKGKIEELERKQWSNTEVKLVTKDDSLGKGQDYLEKKPNVSKRRPVEEEISHELKEVEKRERVNEEGNEKIAEDEIDSRIEDQEIKGQEPYELLKSGEHEKIPQYHREEEKVMELGEIEETKRTAEDVSSGKVQQIKAQESDGLDKHRKLREIQENRNIQESVEEEEMNEGRGYKTELQPKSIASSQSQDVEEKESDQPKRFVEEEKIQELMTDEEGKEEYYIREGEQNVKAKIIPQVESKANDDSSVNNETQGHESTGLRGQKKKQNHQELMEIKTSDQRKEEKIEEVAEKTESIDEYDSSRKIRKNEERKSDKMRENFAEEGTSDDKEAKEENRAGKVLGEVETKTGKVREIEEQEQDKKQSFVEKDTSGKAKDNKNQETKSRDDSSEKKTQENEKQESHEQKRNEEQDKKNLGLVEKKTKYFRGEENAKEDKEIVEAEVPRDLKGVEKQESTKMVERHENQELVREKMNNQEGENKNSVITEALGKAEDHESKGPQGQRKQDKSRGQGLRDKLKDEETAKTETKSKDNESRNIHQTIEQETSEQGRINELVEDRTHYCRDKENREKAFEDGCSKKIQEIDKEESVPPRRDEKQEKIQEPVDRETSEDDEEELEVEFEDEEEDWEAEVIQEMDSDEDNDKIRQIKRIRLGFRLVGGSTLFMSLIVIVISFIRSKRKIRCYKF